ncbi:type VI secretion system baseplate subunit TssK [Draconibacterium sp. IB214405]|uniref:type VI secretion system baseplate subunit TssK n=1 Tax=Draconibacterium sp. IB214405 TaxID=3097352 RepID=UPI002A0D7809|nr:type VI secretion system baseplate subunit TssK [Draconibacterium sp. IB214405]MDX8340119.1 type VI secretion system baseplate subunit TssK [Draconibacterium sp. IB214405]
MNTTKHHFPVNWIDGMKINKDHFIATDLNISQQAVNTYLAFVNPFNYGLLLQNNLSLNEANIVLDIDAQGVLHAKVINCSAVTRGGFRIDIKNNYFSVRELEVSIPQVRVEKEPMNGEEHYIALMVNPFQRTPFGIPDEAETPPRMPSVLPLYSLSLHPVSQIDSVRTGNALVIGKVVYKGDKAELDEDYIPPCQTIYSHPKLAEYHAQLLKVIGQIEIDIVSILKRIEDKRQATSIAETVADVANALLLFLDVNVIEFRNMARYYPPVFIFEQMAAMARNLNNSINKQSTANREELLNYIQDWSNLKQGEFEEMLSKAIEYHYDHDDINASINRLAPFVNAISKICGTLSNLDFIGKKKDRQIFVKEQKEKPGSSFLVD